MPDMKYLSLVMFMCQNSLTPIAFRYATTESTADTRYSVVIAVGMTEFLKFVFSFCLLAAEQRFSFPQTKAIIYNDLLTQPRDLLRSGLPAALYMLQNLLLQVSSGHLPAAVWQVIYQGKLLVVAIMSVLLLQRQFIRAQWLAMAIMGFGIALVQISGGKEKMQVNMGNAAEQDFVTGVLFLLVAGCCSGFASVYFEKIVKGVGTSKRTSLWVQNLQLALITMVLCSYGIVDWMFNAQNGMAGGPSSAHSVFAGFTPKVWLLVVNNAIGGLLVALVIKHADNVLRGFASAFATIGCAVLSVFCFEFEISFSFIIGTLLVIGSAMLYGGVLKLGGSWWNSECVACVHGIGACLSRLPADPSAEVKQWIADSEAKPECRGKDDSHGQG